MKETKKITVSAMFVALGTVFMVLAGVFDTMTLTAAAFASLLVMLIFLEIGAGYAVAVWLCTTLATALCNFGSTVWVEYFLLFGIYPILKAVIERRRRPLWIPLKLGFLTAGVALLYTVTVYFFGLPFFDQDTPVFKILTLVLALAVFFVFDRLLTLSSRFYFQTLQPRMRRFFH